MPSSRGRSATESEWLIRAAYAGVGPWTSNYSYSGGPEVADPEGAARVRRSGQASPPLDSGRMRAAVIADGEVAVQDRPDPEPGAGEVLVRVTSAGLNGADMLQRKGAYPAPPG